MPQNLTALPLGLRIQYPLNQILLLSKRPPSMVNPVGLSHQPCSHQSSSNVEDASSHLPPLPVVELTSSSHHQSSPLSPASFGSPHRGVSGDVFYISFLRIWNSSELSHNVFSNGVAHTPDPSTLCLLTSAFRLFFLSSSPSLPWPPPP